MINQQQLCTKETTVYNLANLLLEPKTDNLQDQVQEDQQPVLIFIHQSSKVSRGSLKRCGTIPGNIPSPELHNSQTQHGNVNANKHITQR